MLAILFSLLLASLQNTQDITTPPDKPAEKQECQISGQVVTQDGGHPLKNAHVVLRPTEGKDVAKPHSQRTVEDGKFCFKSIAPGKYIFGAERRGYVKQMYGAEDTWSEGTPLAVAKGQKFEPTLFRMVRAGVISGKVVDEDGEPVAGAMVEALITPDDAAAMLAGSAGRINGLDKNSLIPVSTTATNDLGEYRLAGLAPGKYFVNASDTGGRMNAMSFSGFTMIDKDEDDSSEEYAPTFYPGTTKAAEAAPIEIKAGDETTASLQLLHEKMVTVSGIVAGEDGAAPAQAFVMLMETGNPMSFMSSHTMAHTDNDGHFTIKHVPPGSYTARAQSISFGEGKEAQSTQMKIEVGQQDINNLRLVLGKGIAITGKLTVEGGQLPKLSEAHVMLSGDEASDDADDSSWGEVQKDGSFKFTGVTPGTHKVQISGLPEQYYVKRVVYGSRVSSERELAVEAGVAPAKLEVVVSPNAATIDGTVQNAKLEPVGGATVIVRTEKQKNDEATSRAVTDQNGKFEMHGLVPGKYVVIAIKGNKPASQPPTESSVTLAESEKKTVTIRIE